VSALEHMDSVFRPANTVLGFSLGVLSWCDALASALENIELPPPNVGVLAEQRLVAAEPADDAMFLIIGLLAFERSFRAALELACAAPPAEAAGTCNSGSAPSPFGR
jgi:hypothetical protein